MRAFSVDGNSSHSPRHSRGWASESRRFSLSVAKVRRPDNESDNVLFDRGAFYAQSRRRLHRRRPNDSDCRRTALSKSRCSRLSLSARDVCNGSTLGGLLGESFRRRQQRDRRQEEGQCHGKLHRKSPGPGRTPMLRHQASTSGRKPNRTPGTTGARAYRRRKSQARKCLNVAVFPLASYRSRSYNTVAAYFRVPPMPS